MSHLPIFNSMLCLFSFLFTDIYSKNGSSHDSPRIPALFSFQSTRVGFDMYALDGGGLWVEKDDERSREV